MSTPWSFSDITFSPVFPPTPISYPLTPSDSPGLPPPLSSYYDDIEEEGSDDAMFYDSPDPYTYDTPHSEHPPLSSFSPEHSANNPISTLCLHSSRHTSALCAVIRVHIPSCPEISGYYPACAYLDADLRKQSLDLHHLLIRTSQLAIYLDPDNSCDNTRLIDVVGFHYTYMRNRMVSYSPDHHFAWKVLYSDAKISLCPTLSFYKDRERVYSANRRVRDELDSK